MATVRSSAGGEKSNADVELIRVVEAAVVLVEHLKGGHAHSLELQPRAGGPDRHA